MAKSPSNNAKYCNTKQQPLHIQYWYKHHSSDDDNASPIFIYNEVCQPNNPQQLFNDEVDQDEHEYLPLPSHADTNKILSKLLDNNSDDKENNKNTGSDGYVNCGPYGQDSQHNNNKNNKQHDQLQSSDNPLEDEDMHVTFMPRFNTELVPEARVVWDWVYRIR